VVNGDSPSYIRGFDSIHPLITFRINGLRLIIRPNAPLIGIKVKISTLLYTVVPSGGLGRKLADRPMFAAKNFLEILNWSHRRPIIPEFRTR
jgi:hypothetical protein